MNLFGMVLLITSMGFAFLWMLSSLLCVIDNDNRPFSVGQRIWCWFCFIFAVDTFIGVLLSPHHTNLWISAHAALLSMICFDWVLWYHQGDCFSTKLVRSIAAYNTEVIQRRKRRIREHVEQLRAFEEAVLDMKTSIVSRSTRTDLELMSRPHFIPDDKAVRQEAMRRLREEGWKNRSS